MRKSARVSLVPLLLLLLLLGACSSSERSVTLALSLAPGMERTMKFTSEQQLSGSSATSISFTYRFRVASVSAAGLAKVESSVLDVTVSKGIPGAATFVESLRRQSYVATVDSLGHVLDLRADRPSGFAVPGFPLVPEASTQSAPTRGDMGVLFGGLNGQRVSIGETWTSALTQSRGSGLRGSLRWTLASVSGSSARLDYTGTLEKQQVTIPGLPLYALGFLSGDASGFVELEKATGWPCHGKMVIRADVPMRESGAPAGAAPALVSMRIVTQFDSLR